MRLTEQETALIGLLTWDAPALCDTIEGWKWAGITAEIEAMQRSSSIPKRLLAAGVTFVSLPGPTRKREPSAYCYRLTYRNPDPADVGCVLLWDVHGGRQPYQIALERESAGTLRWHCTCADAVYRGEDAPHVCKHVRAMQALGRQPIDSSAPLQTSSGAA